MKNDYFIYCSDDEIIIKGINERNIKSIKIPFSIQNNIEEGVYKREIQTKYKYKPKRIEHEHSRTRTTRETQSLQLACFRHCSRILDIRKDTIKESLMDFQGVEHRLEYVTNVHGIEFINDSKATNVNSTWYALECMSKPIIWIVGGKDKGNDYNSLHEIVKEKSKSNYLHGS